MICVYKNTYIVTYLSSKGEIANFGRNLYFLGTYYDIHEEAKVQQKSGNFHCPITGRPSGQF